MTPPPESLAALLLDARRRGTVLATLPDALRPSTLTQAYAVADIVARGMGAAGGWKIGASSARGMAALGLAEPFFAAVPKSAIHQAGPWRSARAVTVDAEIVFELSGQPTGDNLPALRAAVTSVRLGLEVNAPRFARPFEEGGLAIIADGGAHEGLILGPPLPQPDWENLATVPVRLRVDGTEVAQGNGAAVLGDPWAALLWLAGTLPRFGHAFAPGQIVASGNMAFTEVQPGQELEADFGPHGTMRLQVEHATAERDALPSSPVMPQARE